MTHFFEKIRNTKSKIVVLNDEELKQFQNDYNTSFKNEGKFMTDAVVDSIKSGRVTLHIMGKIIRYEE